MASAANCEEQDSLQIDPREYETQFEVMAMGIVADELPQSCVEPFLKYIKEHHQGSAQLFQTFTGGPAIQQHNGIKAEQQENHVNGTSAMAVQNNFSAASFDKKRGPTDVAMQVNSQYKSAATAPGKNQGA